MKTDKSVFFTVWLTFDLQGDVVLIDTEVVPGYTDVFPAVVGLSCVNLQSPVLMVDVRVSVQRAGPAVFEPETDRRSIFFFLASR